MPRAGPDDAPKCLACPACMTAHAKPDKLPDQAGPAEPKLRQARYVTFDMKNKCTEVERKMGGKKKSTREKTVERKIWKRKMKRERSYTGRAVPLDPNQG